MSERRGASDRPPQPALSSGAPEGRGAPATDEAAPREEATPREIDVWMYELTARLAHDMRTPLGAIRMWSHVLRTGREADRPAALDAIEASTAGLSEHMAFLADVTRAVMGRLPVEKQACDLVSLSRQGVEAAARDLARRIVRVDLQIAVPDDHPLWLDGDPARLRRTFSALVAAAGAFVAAEGTVFARLTTVGDPGPARFAAFIVRAPRARVDETELRHLFTPYYPGKTDLRTPRPDFGLGPVFARCMAQMHGGDVSGAQENDDQEGALVFTARLPLRSESPRGAADAAAKK